MRLGCGPRLFSCGALRTHDTRIPFASRELSVSLMCWRDILINAQNLNIRFYRLAAQSLPLLGAADLPHFWRQLKDCERLAGHLGRWTQESGIRLTVHPALTLQLGSEDKTVAVNGAAVAAAWAALFDEMALGPEARIVVHLGGGNSFCASENFIANYLALPESARRRLALENDEVNCPLELALSIAKQLGLPVVWDYLHWRRRHPDGEGAAKAFTDVTASWPTGVAPKLHFSSPSTTTARRSAACAHAEYLDPFGFLDFYRSLQGNCDIMLEAGAKDFALLKLRADLAALGVDWYEDGNGRRPPAR